MLRGNASGTECQQKIPRCPARHHPGTAYLEPGDALTISNSSVLAFTETETTFSARHIVLGLMVELEDRYMVTSNRESGFGRYDVMLEPREASRDDAFILEFKVQDMKEKDLSDTVSEALRQIEERDYQAALIARGIPQERIHKYGIAFFQSKCCKTYCFCPTEWIY